MHAAVFAALFIAALPAVAANATTVLVLLEYQNARYSQTALQTMQSEAARLLNGSGIELQWKVNGKREIPEAPQLVMFRMTGKCAMDSFPAIPDSAAAPLARTHSADGEILSFGEVDCDRVRVSVKRALRSDDYGRADQVLGRALGRVLSHEMYHMLAKTSEHAGQGVARSCLSASELTAEHLAFSRESLQSIRKQMAFLQNKSPAVSDGAMSSAATLP
jgi:hypothetical protein